MDGGKRRVCQTGLHWRPPVSWWACDAWSLGLYGPPDVQRPVLRGHRGARTKMWGARRDGGHDAERPPPSTADRCRGGEGAPAPSSGFSLGPGSCSEPPKAEAALSPEAGRSCLYPNSLRPGINSEPYYLPCLSATGASNRIFLKMSE